MFLFFNHFDTIAGHPLTLKIIEKNPGDQQAIPFYYYNILLSGSDQPIGKISLRVGHNFHSYYNGNIGYEIDLAHRGHHYAAAACQMLSHWQKRMEWSIWTSPAMKTISPPTKLSNALAQNCSKSARLPKAIAIGTKPSSRIASTV